MTQLGDVYFDIDRGLREEILEKMRTVEYESDLQKVLNTFSDRVGVQLIVRKILVATAPEMRYENRVGFKVVPK